ncbi:hypothetical protein BT69DRAFT_1279977 [Atractiella rhizophila]|nr:hypothetical protein BT69DRAFT_1279977 [Atractiella rhizophila]
MKPSLPEKDLGPQISVAAGISVSLVASLFQSLGLTIQRKSHLQNEALPSSKRRSDWKRPLWLVGFGVFIVSNILSTVFQLSALPIVILAPLGAVSLIYNAFCARLILGDVFSRYLAIGTLFVAGGAVMVALFGVVPEPSHTLPQLIALYTRPAFLAWISVFSFLVICLLLISHVSEYSLRRQMIDLEASLLSSDPTSQAIHKQLLLRRSQGRVPIQRPLRFHKRYHSLDSSRILPPLPLPTSRTNIVRSAGGQVEGEEAKVEAMDRKKVERLQFLVGAGYGASSGCLSGLCLLFAKTGTELLIQSIAGPQNHFKHPEPWAIVIVLLLAAIAQLFYLNRALTFGGPTFVCPLAFMFYNLSSIISGLFYYDEWRLLSPSHIALVFTGTIVLLLGVWIVSLQDSDPKRTTSQPVVPTEQTALLPARGPRAGHDDEEESDDSSSDSEDEEGERRSSLLNSYRGFAIGISASSPGFSIRPSLPRPNRQTKRSVTYSGADSAHHPYPSGSPPRMDGEEATILGPPLERTVSETDSELARGERERRRVGRHRSLAGDPYVGFRRASGDGRAMIGGRMRRSSLREVDTEEER